MLGNEIRKISPLGFETGHLPELPEASDGQ
jgi:hypothetical protein